MRTPERRSRTVARATESGDLWWTLAKVYRDAGAGATRIRIVAGLLSDDHAVQHAP